MTALPSEGYSGEVPGLVKYLPAATERHETVWTDLWSTPQACVWAIEPWRRTAVADLVKWTVRSEADDAPAAVGNIVRQLRDDCGLSTAGLAREGWAITRDEVAAKADEKSTEAPAAKPARRLRAVDAQ